MVREINEGRCLRCDAVSDPAKGCLAIVAAPALYSFGMCLECWNELVAQDGRMREKEVTALYEDGHEEKIRPW
jgi:hypothetical protein